MAYDARANDLREIAVVSGLLGGVLGTALVLLLCGMGQKYTNLLGFAVVLAAFYLCEFQCTARYQGSKTTSRLFLIYGNVGNGAFVVMQLFLAGEYLVARSLVIGPYRVSDGKISTGIGLSMAAAGLYIRFLAMRTCGESFSHYVNTGNDTDTHSNEVLVTHGVYSVFRHPSYLGFWLMVVGTQVMMKNRVSSALCVVVLRAFFRKRIAFEEWFLEHRLFGHQYARYKAKTAIWIPFV